MVEKNITLHNANGLHMRPGKLFVQEAKKQACSVTVAYNGKSADAKSLIRLLKLGMGKGSKIVISCDGENEQQSADHLERFIASLDE